MKKDKVLFITPEFGERFCGGLGTVVNELSIPLSREVSLDVMLLMQGETRNIFGEFFTATIFRLENDKVKKISSKYYKMALNILKNYDVIHFFHYSKEILGIINFIKKKSLRAKIVFSCHYLLKYEQNIRRVYPELLKIEEEIYQRADGAHVLTEVSQNAILKCYPEIVTNTKFFKIPNGVNYIDYPLNKYLLENKINQDDIVVLTVTRWCHGKGLEYLLDAVPLVVEKHKNVKFVIGGRKEKSWENQVEEYVKMIDDKIDIHKNNIIPLGWLNKDQMNSLFKMSDIWVMCSELEYFPYGLLEPMIANVPIITSRFPGFSEIIEEETECLAFEPKNHKELAEKIINLIENKEKRAKIKQNAYTKVTQVYNWESVAKHYAEMYKSLI